MSLMILMAVMGGMLVSVSRSINGRLSLSGSPLKASFWNHLVGFALLTALGLALDGLAPAGLAEAPPLAWAGGTLGVIFVASGSWLIGRIGAVNTAMLVIAGQMVSGVVLDAALGLTGQWPLTLLGVALILMGMYLTQTRRS
jgi:transporter family-2 protein